MTLVQRLAIFAGALLLLGGAAATFLPTSPQGATCGTWVSPEWTDDETDQLVSQASELMDQNLSDEIAAQGYSIAAGARTSQRLCNDALGTRRTVSIVLLTLGVLVPAGMLFVGASRREDALTN